MHCEHSLVPGDPTSSDVSTRLLLQSDLHPWSFSLENGTAYVATLAKQAKTRLESIAATVGLESR